MTQPPISQTGIAIANRSRGWRWIARRAGEQRRKAVVAQMGPGAQRLRKRCILLHDHDLPEKGGA